MECKCISAHDSGADPADAAGQCLADRKARGACAPRQIPAQGFKRKANQTCGTASEFPVFPAIPAAYYFTEPLQLSDVIYWHYICDLSSLPFGMMMAPLLEHYQDDVLANMLGTYQYILSPSRRDR